MVRNARNASASMQRFPCLVFDHILIQWLALRCGVGTLRPFRLTCSGLTRNCCAVPLGKARVLHSMTSVFPCTFDQAQEEFVRQFDYSYHIMASLLTYQGPIFSCIRRRSLHCAPFLYPLHQPTPLSRPVPYACSPLRPHRHP